MRRVIAAVFSAFALFGSRNNQQRDFYGVVDSPSSDDPKSSSFDYGLGVLNEAAEAWEFPTIFPGAEAVMIGGEDLKTTVYCGPKINCDFLRKAAREKEINLIEFDQGQRVTKKRTVDRFVVMAHGASEARQLIETGENLVLRVDEFIKKFGSKRVKVGHSLGCSVGKDVQSNFGHNSLESGQIIFLHSGDYATSIGGDDLIAKSLTIEPRKQFPLPSSFKILYDKPDPNDPKQSLETVVLEFNPLPLDRLVEALNKEPKITSLYNLIAYSLGRQKEPKITSLYNLIAKSVKSQRASALETFAENPDDANIILSEIERLGFADFTQETDLSKQEKFVRDYLGQYSINLALKMDKISQSEISSVDKLLSDGLMDANYVLEESTYAAYIAAEYGSSKYLDVLLKHGAVIRQEPFGANAVCVSAQYLQIDSLKVMKKYGIDFNLRSVGGETPIFYVIDGYKKSTSNDKSKYLEVIDILIKGGADTSLIVPVLGNAYQFAGEEKALVDQMRKSEKERDYAGVRNPKASKVVKEKSRENDL